MDADVLRRQHRLSDGQALPHLEVAYQIACRLRDRAHWHGQQCQWTVVVPDFTKPGIGHWKHEVSPPSLYQGTAGIGLFLAEVGTRCQDSTILRAAQGALRHAVAARAQLAPDAIGLYTGHTGIALALARAALVTRDAEVLAAAHDLVPALLRAPGSHMLRDVMAGGAGAIPAFLELATLLEAPALRQRAVDIGAAILDAAYRGPHGWSWSTGSLTTEEHLLGYSHGAAGYGAALLELFAATRQVAFLHGAEQAFAYEQHHYDVIEGNWPDFRYHALTDELSRPGGRDGLPARARSGWSPPPNPRSYMATWCHGAPGVALTRLRAYELLGQAYYRDQAEAAVRTTERTLKQEDWNYSLCHGLGGNADVLIEAARTLATPDYADIASGVLTRGCERYEGGARAWSCGTSGGRSDPSLMVGEAGIGYTCLRLADATVRSVLIVTPPQREEEIAGTRAHYAQPSTIQQRQRAEQRDAARFFASCLRVIPPVQRDHLWARVAEIALPSPNVPQTTFEWLRAILPAATRLQAPSVRQAICAELVRFRLASRTRNRALDDLGRLAGESINLREGHWLVRLHPQARLLAPAARYRGPATAEPGREDSNQWSPKALAGLLVHRQEDEWHIRPLPRALGQVLQLLTQERSIREVIEQLSDDGEAHDPVRARAIQQFVYAQLHLALAANVVIARPEPKPAVTSAVMPKPTAEWVS